MVKDPIGGSSLYICWVFGSKTADSAVTLPREPLPRAVSLAETTSQVSHLFNTHIVKGPRWWMLEGIAGRLLGKLESEPENLFSDECHVRSRDATANGERPPKTA